MRFKKIQYPFFLLIGIFISSYDNALMWIPHNVTDDESPVILVMAWFHQTIRHYLSNLDPDLCRHMASLAHSDLCKDHSTHFPQCRIYASMNWVGIASCNGLSPVRRQAITWTNDDLLPIRHDIHHYIVSIPMHNCMGETTAIII